MSALDTALENPDIKRNFLCNIKAGRVYEVWTQDTNAWYASAALKDDEKFSRSWAIADVKDNGSSLTKVSSVSNVQSTPGSWTYDAQTNRVYVNLAAGTPYTRTVAVMYEFYFGTHAKTFNVSGTDVYYEPRIMSIPNMSLRIEQTFSSVTQIGGGNMALSNSDGYFDGIFDMLWNAGDTVIRIGVDVDDHVETFANYEVIGTWKNSDVSLSESQFSISLKEYKINIKRKIPADVYRREDYQTMYDDDVGRAVQIAYGRVYDAKPVLIDTSTLTFKVAGHPVVSFDGLRVKNQTTGVWDAIPFASTDLANAQFTVSPSDYIVGQDIAVDFTGKPLSGGQEMDNPVDVIKDILTTYVGETAINSQSFTDARAVYDIGLVIQTGKRNTLCPVSMYIDTQKTAEELVKSILELSSAYLYADSSGQYFIKAFEPSRSEAAKEFNDSEIISISASRSKSTVTKAVVYFGKRYVSDWSEVVTYEDVRYQYSANENSSSIKVVSVPTYKKSSAQIVAERIVAYGGNGVTTYTIKVPSRKAIKIMPADTVRIKSSRAGIDQLMEVISISHNLRSDVTTMTLSNMHNTDDRAGFLVADNETIPSRYSGLAGYGTGSVDWNPTWDDEIKKWARENVGYWTDDNDFADPVDPVSRNLSTWT